MIPRDDRRALRPADLIPPLASAVALVSAALAGAPLPGTLDARLAWLCFAAAWLLAVAVPVRVLPALSPRAARAGAHLTLALFLGVLVLSPAGNGPGSQAAIAIAGLCLVLVYPFGGARGAFEPGEFLFRVSPLLLTVYVYGVLGVVLHRPAVTYDLALAAADDRLFGGAWSVAAQRWQSPALTEWFAANYLAYLAWPVITAVALHAYGMKRAFEDFALSFTLAMFAGFLFYFVVPAEGPFGALGNRFSQPWPEGYAITRAFHGIVSGFGYRYDAYPSLHVGNVLLALVAIRRNFPRAFPIALFFAANLIASTIYLRMHYTIDVVCGAALAFSVAMLVPWLNGEREPAVTPLPHSGWVRGLRPRGR